jgi:adenosine kinase
MAKLPSNCGSKPRISVPPVTDFTFFTLKRLNLMTTLICGSLAFDNIMVFPDRFKNHILPEQIHILNVAFLVPELRREYGGCAGNIAYNLMLLGGEALIMATVGDDATPYLDRLDKLGLPRTHIRHVAGSFTAQAFITTDLDDNQITAFHPGAMSFSHLNKVEQATSAKLGIVAPDGREGMMQHARDFAAADLPFIFDPGQGLPMFNGDELLEFIKLAEYACFNDYEAKLLCDRTGRSLDQLACEVKALIVTQGRRWFGNSRQWSALRYSLRAGRMRSLTRLVAATLTVPACFMALPTALTGSKPGSWRR